MTGALHGGRPDAADPEGEIKTRSPRASTRRLCDGEASVLRPLLSSEQALTLIGRLHQCDPKETKRDTLVRALEEHKALSRSCLVDRVRCSTIDVGCRCWDHSLRGWPNLLGEK